MIIYTDTLKIHGSLDISDWGDKESLNIRESEARISISSKQIMLPSGEYAMFDAQCHLPPESNIKMGEFIEYNDETYCVNDVKETKTIDGDVMFYFCLLNIQPLNT